MGCCGERERNEKISDTQKWDYINLSDFKAQSCIAPMSYVILYILLIVSIACYIVDLFTAVQLLIFDRWSGKIQPALDLKYARWIFLGCIIASYVFLAFRWWRAMRAIKSGGIAQSYLDPLAVRLQSIRVGKNGRGWRRFLVFAEMTKGKKGADTIALFTYFSFEAWYRIIFAEAPRNAINAMTIYSVFKAQLLPNGNDKKLSPIMQFLTNVKLLADGDYIRAAVLVGMLFVLITWVIAALSLLISCFFYVCFLWNHIARTDKSLRSFCKRRIDTRLSSIVDEKVDKALLRADAKRAKINMKAGMSGENIADIRKAPTLPNVEPTPGDMLPSMPLARQDTNASLGSFTSMPNSARQPMLSRMDTNGSVSSFRSHASNAPLMGDASPMGSGPPPRSYSPAPLPSRMASDRSAPPRSLTPAGRPPYQGSVPPSPLSRQNTQGSAGGHLISPLEPPMESMGGPGPVLRQGTGPSNYGNQGRSSPAPGYRPPQAQAYEMRSQTPNRGMTSSPFRPYSPSVAPSTQRSFTAPQGQATRPPPTRNFTSPLNGGQPPTRNFTSPLNGGPPPTQNFSSPLNGGPPQPGNFRGPPRPPAPSSSYDDSIYDHY